MIKKVNQTKFYISPDEGGPPEPSGNCFSACMASILDLRLEAIPEIFEKNFGVGEFWQILADWSELQGFQVYTSLVEFGLQYPVDHHYIAMGKSPRGNFRHGVICLNGMLWHDPHPSGMGLLTEDTYIWCRKSRCL